MDIRHNYSYTATFEDGTQIFRDMNDPDADKPKLQENGSRFTDVNWYSENHSPLISFVVHNDEESWGVDLRDGHFEFNERVFWQHRADLPSESYKDFRVVHYRTVQKTYNQQTMEQTSGEATSYTIGWQTNDKKGNNVQRTVTF